MDTMVDISVIMLTYNRENYIQRAIESIIHRFHQSTDGAWTETMWRVLMFTEWMKGRHVNV